MTAPNQCAFPNNIVSEFYDTGLSKREYFAAIALQGLMANSRFYESAGMVPHEFAKKAVQHADALIAALRQNEYGIDPEYEAMKADIG